MEPHVCSHAHHPDIDTQARVIHCADCWYRFPVPDPGRHGAMLGSDILMLAQIQIENLIGLKFDYPHLHKHLLATGVGLASDLMHSDVWLLQTGLTQGVSHPDSHR